ncbi:MAG: polymer-forming cytoskeletal protein [Myxococcales bacterium]|nr:polymer-forming cytoskeletal protein [Polyangiaceae bacterium]MDW8248651.1 polymer-forming cytoskeletal protein [Myxococcales bacterium]
MPLDPPLLPNELNALLGRGTRFEGKLYFEGATRIDGIFRGEIRSDDALVIGEGADVEGQIDVAAVIVRGGTVRADIRARKSIELFVPARVWGNLHAPAIMLEKGVQFEGSCRMAPVDDPTQGGLSSHPSPSSADLDPPR